MKKVLLLTVLMIGISPLSYGAGKFFTGADFDEPERKSTPQESEKYKLEKQERKKKEKEEREKKRKEEKLAIEKNKDHRRDFILGVLKDNITNLKCPVITTITELKEKLKQSSYDGELAFDGVQWFVDSSSFNMDRTPYSNSLQIFSDSLERIKRLEKSYKVNTISQPSKPELRGDLVICVYTLSKLEGSIP